MLEYVKDYGLKFNGALQKRSKTNLIVIHHTEGGASETVQSIHAFHRSLGHKGIDYNVCVQKDGTVVWGRGLDTVGGHTNNLYPTTKGVNARSVGIVALGNMQKNQMPEAQLEALKRVVRDVVLHFGIKDIKSHKEIAKGSYTDCPGKYFPVDEVRAYVLGAQSDAPVPTPPVVPFDVPELTRNLQLKTPYMRGEDIKQAQTRLFRHLVDVGGIDGIFGAKTKEAVIKFQKARIKEGRDIGKVDGIVGNKTWAILWE